MKRIAAIALAAALLISAAACSKTTAPTESTGSEAAASAGENSGAESGAASSEAASEGMTKEKYDSMTEDDLLADIKNLESVTPDEYAALIETYRFVDIVDEEDQTNYMTLAENITDKAIQKLTSDALPSFSDYSDRLFESEYPQVRGYALSRINSLFGVSDDNLGKAKSLLENETDDYVLYCAIAALRNELKKDPAIKDFVFRMADSENPKLRYQAALAIGNSWSKDVDGAVDKIIEMMKDENEDVRGVACEYSGKLADDKVIDPILEVLNDENSTPSLKGHCISGLCTLWYDFPFHKNTSEKAYKATMDYFKTQPFSEDQPYWITISSLSNVAESSFDAWKESASYYNPDEIYEVMTDIIKSPDTNWLGRTAAIKVIKAHCSEQQFKDLKTVIDALDDDKAHFVQEEYEKQASSDQ